MMLTCVGRHLHGLDERPSRSYSAVRETDSKVEPVHGSAKLRVVAVRFAKAVAVPEGTSSGRALFFRPPQSRLWPRVRASDIAARRVILSRRADGTSWFGYSLQLKLDVVLRQAVKEIDVNNSRALRDWCEELHASEEEVRRAVDQVGLDADKVRQHLVGGFTSAGPTS